MVKGAPRVTNDSKSLVKSRQRVADHGEVFTPDWMVEDMLDLVKSESERIDSRFLEPACGSGNFLVAVLRRKLASVQARYGKSDFEKRHYALLALMSIYGIELLADNVTECRDNLLAAFTDYLGVGNDDQWCIAASTVLNVNIVGGDALTMTTSTNEPITFPEWAYLGKGKFQRRDFCFKSLTHRSADKDSLFSYLDEMFAPTEVYSSMTVEGITQ